MATSRHLPSESIETNHCVRSKDSMKNMFYLTTGITLSLKGDSIPTNGSGHICISAVGDNNSNALICRSIISISGNGNWYLHPTEISTNDSDKIMSSGDVYDRGWSKSIGTDSERYQLVRLRRASYTAEEGVFTCDIPGKFNTPVSVGIYYPCKL